MKNFSSAFELGALVGAALIAIPSGAAEMQRASDAQATTITIYDQGFALVQELRRVTLHSGDNEIVFSGLPRSLDPATTAFSVTAGIKQLQLMEQTFSGSNSPAPELRWIVKSGGDGFANLRLSYRADGFGWSGAHEMSLNGEGTMARFSTRIALQNRSGHAFDSARIRLVLTERGAAQKLPIEGTAAATSLPERFAYGSPDAAADRLVAGLSAVQTYELADAISLPDGPSKYVTMYETDKLPVKRIQVYDGVRFDRFQRSRLTDWNYGTLCHNIVDAFVEFVNESGDGLGQPLPPGNLRLTQRRDDALDLLGETVLPAVATNGAARVRIGPARGLRGERERTGYSEIKPAHEYEESFEIRLKNESGENATIRAVEHLYRSDDFDIVKADAEYKKTGPQTIEFAPEIRAGGQRNVHYTVRYRW